MNDDERAALTDIADAIQQRASLIGPTDDEDYVAETGDMWVLSEWVIVANWTNVKDGDSRLVRMGSPDLLAHHRSGLLHEALNTDWADR